MRRFLVINLVVNAKPFAYDNTIVINFCLCRSNPDGRFPNTSTSVSIALKLLSTILAPTFELFMIERMVGWHVYMVFIIY